jgi:hypothetical protein
LEPGPLADIPSALLWAAGAVPAPSLTSYLEAKIAKKKLSSSPSEPAISLDQLQREKAERLKLLLRHKRDDKGYKRTLRAFLDSDAALQQALLSRIEGRL